MGRGLTEVGESSQATGRKLRRSHNEGNRGNHTNSSRILDEYDRRSYYWVTSFEDTALEAVGTDVLKMREVSVFESFDKAMVDFAIVHNYQALNVDLDNAPATVTPACSAFVGELAFCSPSLQREVFDYAHDQGLYMSAYTLLPTTTEYNQRAIDSELDLYMTDLLTDFHERSAAG